jgi:hypothetical protein
MRERRQNVRVRPTADYAIRIELGGGIVKVQLFILDVAVGGVALEISERLLGLAVGGELRLGVTLPGVPRFETIATLRHTQGRLGGRCGFHFNHLTNAEQSALSKAVSELLERGHSA